MLQATFKTRRTRALVFDLESAPSAFWFGDKTTARITAIGWKWRDEPEARTLMLTHAGRFVNDDGKTVSEGHGYLQFRDVLREADLVYGHNIRQFDLPLFQSGLWRLKLPLLPELRTTDTLRDIPKRKDMSASLENLAAGLDLPGEKKHMSITDWERANRLTRSGVTLARERVVSDVLLQEKLRDELEAKGYLGEPRWWKPTR